MSDVKQGTTGRSEYFNLLEKTAGTAKTGITIAQLLIGYTRQGQGPVTAAASALPNTSAAYSSGGAIEIDATNLPGLYRADVPNAAYSSNASVNGVIVSLTAATTTLSVAPAFKEVNLVINTPSDNYSLITAGVKAVTVTGNVGGSVGSVVGNVGGSVASVVGNVGGLVSGSVGSVVGNVGGSVNSVATSVLASSVTGNVGGSVASVVGNVGGLVSGSVGSVVGNVGGSVNSVVGNVGGSVGSVVGGVGGSVSVVASVSGNVGGSVGSVVGNVGGSVASVIGNVGGSVASVVASVLANSVTGNVGGSVGSVVGGVGGAVASVTGNVGGSVGSVLASVLASSVTGNVGGSVNSVNNTVTVGAVSLTAAYDAAKTAVTTGGVLTEGYRANGATGTLPQILYELLAHHSEASISGVTKTLNKLDHSTVAATLTLDSTTPASVSRAT